MDSTTPQSLLNNLSFIRLDMFASSKVVPSFATSSTNNGGFSDENTFSTIAPIVVSSHIFSVSQPLIVQALLYPMIRIFQFCFHTNIIHALNVTLFL
jgi:hypothetical protein